MLNPCRVPHITSVGSSNLEARNMTVERFHRVVFIYLFVPILWLGFLLLSHLLFCY